MSPTATLRPSDLLLEANGLEAKEKRTAKQQARLEELKTTLDGLAEQERQQLEAPNEQSAKEAAEVLATATTPDRPEGAADDEPISQEEREATADFDPGEQPPIVGATNDDGTPVTAEQAAAALNDPAFREKLQETSGLAQDRADAAALDGELSGYVPGESDGEHVLPGTDVEPAGDEVSGELVAAEPQYDVTVWQAIVGGAQPDETKYAIKSIAGLVLENLPAGGLRSDQVVELRVTATVTGYGIDQQLKLKDGELEHGGRPEKRTLTVTDAWIVGD